MYISVLDYVNGEVIIVEVDDNIDAEDYVASNFSFDNVYYLTTVEFPLTIKKD